MGTPKSGNTIILGWQVINLFFVILSDHDFYKNINKTTYQKSKESSWSKYIYLILKITYESNN